MTTRSSFPFRRASLAVALALAFAAAGTAQIPRQEKAQLDLAADRTAYEAGTTAHVVARVTIEPGWHVNSHTPTFEYLIPTNLDLELPSGWPEESVRYPQAKTKTFAFADQPLSVYDGEVEIHSDVAIPAGTANGPVAVAAALHYQACNDSECLPPVTTKADLKLTVGPGGKAVANVAGVAGTAAGPETAGPAKAGGEPRSLALMLLLAVVGGLILNAMPCVLPILSLKVFGLMRSAGHGRGEVARGALATALGILVSFWALALAAIAARAAGAAVGWGVQFQRPGFVAFLAVIVVLFCLNLWGLFEIPLPQRLARLGGTGPREGAAGHFASGLFATLMATPCSAPFLGTAVGFALAQPAPVILAIFTAVGFGMALPYLLLAVAPGTARLLPRPGAWMETVRGLMGFLLAAAAVWLFYVLTAQVTPERLAVIQLALITMALFIWLRHRGMMSGAGMRRFAEIGVVAAAALTIGAAAIVPAAKSAGLIAWEPFDRARAESLAGEGRMVFVDVTADWCFTCKTNERLVLETPEVANAFRERRVVPMRADWTKRDDTIGAFLAEHGRYGIPFYLLYRPGREPVVFSELITRDRLVEAVRGGAAVAQR
jgi:suppressor for copper-sensitivity B